MTDCKLTGSCWPALYCDRNDGPTQLWLTQHFAFTLILRCVKQYCGYSPSSNYTDFDTYGNHDATYDATYFKSDTSRETSPPFSAACPTKTTQIASSARRRLSSRRRKLSA